ncbi:MAG: deoxyribose-phosphate aldolase [Erysipelotrichaceae bacterium]|nr:deoxyribose-phosphate aldolase [Erysipelotrichaceae bacterium]
MNIQEFAKMVDATAVQFNMDRQEIVDLMNLVNKYQFKAYAVMPEYDELATQMAKEAGNTVSLKIGPVGFPYGTPSTEEKLAEIRKGLANGAGEFDFTNNIEFIKKGDYEAMLKELKQLVTAAGPGMTTKVIIETPQLTDEEIVKAAQTVLESGATFVKTGTGHFGATTLHHVQLINEAVGGKIKIKAASGIRDLKTVEEMMKFGVTRFGIGIRGIKGIVEELGG